MAKKIHFAGRDFHLPAAQWLRVVIGLIFIVGGLLGFMPILGFWMIPVGLLILSVDIPMVRRWRRQLTVWWHRKRDERAERLARRKAKTETELES
jgi:UPF0716 family protein affecting phage T7 exclusion